MNHQGAKLRTYLKSKGIKISQVTNVLNHGSKNTIHNWFKKPILNNASLKQLSTIYPDIVELFPEVDWEVMLPKPSAELEVQVLKLQNEYSELNSKYLRLLEEHVELLRRKQ
jgi:hypothetical protein